MYLEPIVQIARMANGANGINTLFEGGSNLASGKVGSVGDFFRTTVTGELKNAKTVAGELGAFVHDWGCTALAFTPAAPVLAAWQGVQGVIELSRGDIADAAANFGSAILMFPPLKIAKMFVKSCAGKIFVKDGKNVVALLKERKKAIGKLGKRKKKMLDAKKAGGDLSVHEAAMEKFRTNITSIDDSIYNFAKTNTKFHGAWKKDLRKLSSGSGSMLLAPFRAAKRWAQSEGKIAKKAVKAAKEKAKVASMRSIAQPA